jgi:hypothetical protein
MRRVENQSARCRRAVFHHCPLAAGTLAFSRPRIDRSHSPRRDSFDLMGRIVVGWSVFRLLEHQERQRAQREAAGLTRRVLLSGGRRSRVLRETPGSVSGSFP